MWKKELNFVALMAASAWVGIMKTIFITLNSRFAMSLSVSYTAAAALTGVPLMVSAASGIVSLIVARLWGKRPVYLAAVALMFVGAIWNMNATDNYAQSMASRVFQGLGWGVFDALVLSSIHDTYFVSSSLFRMPFRRCNKASC
jgi:MFS family permease